MDPNATLTELLDACRHNDRDTACEALMNLYRWLRMEGFMPDDPRLALVANSILPIRSKA